MKLTCKKNFKLNSNDTIAVFIEESSLKKKDFNLPDELSFIKNDIDFSFFKAGLSETIFIPLAGKPNVILCGTGKEEDIEPEKLRNAGASITSLCNSRGIENISVYVPAYKNMTKLNVLKSVAEGFYLSNYRFDKYITKKEKNDKPLMTKISIICEIKNADMILKEVEILAENTLLCRDLVNELSDSSNATQISSIAKKISKVENISCKVYNKAELEKMNMGLLLAVNRGSSTPPALAVLTYNGNPKSKKYFALVGKGITFDSGGMNLKPSGHLETMRMDMAGAATVMYALKAAAELNIKKNIYAVMPLTDNMIASNAYRPGDIYKSYNGKTVEVGNTDAEGRLILADALSFTEDRLKPECIIDVATLTGACLAALGETVAAYLTEDDMLSELLKEAAETTGEKAWQLPLFNDFKENMKSEIADISNMAAEKNAGTINAAVFLSNFVEKTRWAHIDIAGTAWYSKQRGYRPKNATGYGVRLLVETVKNWHE